ncbi:MAG: DNA polymerase III subunit beta [Vicinamibacteria bacterium]|nr:DNA polymerase III subunit beta [Vicinamibacteria bacterium]
MDLVVDRSEFAKELYLVQGIAERRNAIPILSNVLLETSAGKIELSATDLDLSLRTSANAQVSEPGCITVNAKKLYEIVRSLPDSDVHMKVVEDSWLILHCAQARFKIAGISRDNFPVMPDMTQCGEIRFVAESLNDLINRTLFAMTAEDHRYFLSGALLVVENGSAALVATDGHRLSYARRDASCSEEAKKRTLLPRKAVQELVRLMDGESEVFFGQTEQHLLFKVGRRSMASKTVEGQFPAFESVVATKGDKIVEVERERLIGALKRVCLLSSERTRAVRVALENGRLIFSATSPDLGEAREEVEVEYEGGEVVVGFNGQYLIDFLGSSGGERICIELKNAESQGVFRPAGDKTVDHRYVVMPMRL